MANLAQISLGGNAQQAQIRALLEDLLEEVFVGRRPGNNVALAVWFKRSSGLQEQHVFLMYGGRVLADSFIAPVTVPLYWKSGSRASPLVYVEATDVDTFLKQQRTDPKRLAPYQDDYEVLYFDKTLLTSDILDTFRILTEPPGMMKGWYVEEEEYRKSTNVAGLLSYHRSFKPYFGLVKTEEKDFEHCRGILHLEVSQRWVPFSPEGIQSYSYFTDLQNGRRVFFLFEGGALYEVLRFEVKTAPDYVGRFGLLGTTRNDRYPEVYLRAVRPPAQPAA